MTRIRKVNLLIGLICVVVPSLYWVFVDPQLTAASALREFMPIYLAGVVLLLWSVFMPHKEATPALSLQSIEVFKLDPGDTLVVTVQTILTQQQRAYITANLKMILPSEDFKLVILDAGTRISMLRFLDEQGLKPGADGKIEKIPTPPGPVPAATPR